MQSSNLKVFNLLFYQQHLTTDHSSLKLFFFFPIWLPGHFFVSFCISSSIQLLYNGMLSPWTNYPFLAYSYSLVISSSFIGLNTNCISNFLSLAQTSIPDLYVQVPNEYLHLDV